MKIDLNIKNILTAIFVAGLVIISADMYMNAKRLKDDLSNALEDKVKIQQQRLMELDSAKNVSLMLIRKDSLIVDSVERIIAIINKKRINERVRYIGKIKEIKVFNDSTRNRYIDSLNSFITRQH